MARLPSGFAKRMREAARQERIAKQAPAMLEALKEIAENPNNVQFGTFENFYVWARDKARAIIRAAEGGE